MSGACTCRCPGRCSRRCRTRASKSACTGSSTVARCCGTCRTRASSRSSARATTTRCSRSSHPPIATSRSVAGKARPPPVLPRSLSRLLAAGTRFLDGLVPTLSRQGYEWVIVDSEHVQPVTPMSWEELRYRPHRARVGDAEIVVVVRDRDLSNAQESGMEAGWFIEEVRARTQRCDFPLVTTASDGENGGWFRNSTRGSNFWGGFYSELVERDRAGQSGGVRPPSSATTSTATAPRLGHGQSRRVEHGRHHGAGFVQWTGSAAQRDALGRVAQLSDAVHATAEAVTETHGRGTARAGPVAGTPRPDQLQLLLGRGLGAALPPGPRRRHRAPRSGAFRSEPRIGSDRVRAGRRALPSVEAPRASTRSTGVRARAPGSSMATGRESRTGPRPPFRLRRDGSAVRSASMSLPPSLPGEDARGLAPAHRTG